MDKKKKIRRKNGPKRLNKDQLSKLTGGWFGGGGCSSRWCCSLETQVPDGCTNATAHPIRNL